MKVVLILILNFLILHAVVYKEGDIIRQKQELKKLKKELDEFYQLKEREYKQQKQQIQKLLNEIKKEKEEILKIKKENEKLLKEIQGTITSKTIQIYNKTKPKITAKIFAQMIKDGKIDEVFDIIIKMKTNQITKLLKFLTPKDSSLLTDMLQQYKQHKGE